MESGKCGSQFFLVRRAIRRSAKSLASVFLQCKSNRSIWLALRLGRPLVLVGSRIPGKTTSHRVFFWTRWSARAHIAGRILKICPRCDEDCPCERQLLPVFFRWRISATSLATTALRADDPKASAKVAKSYFAEEEGVWDAEMTVTLPGQADKPSTNPRRRRPTPCSAIPG